MGLGAEPLSVRNLGAGAARSANKGIYLEIALWWGAPASLPSPGMLRRGCGCPAPGDGSGALSSDHAGDEGPGKSPTPLAGGVAFSTCH